MELLEYQRQIIQHEHTVKKLLECRGFKIWKHPSGNSNDFPDVGASIEIDGVLYNLHIEVKSNKNTTMGQIRNWIFKDGVFSVTKVTSPNTELLIEIMNSSSEASQKANYILKQLQKYFSPEVTELSQSCLGVIKNINERNEKLHNFIDNYDDSYHIFSKTSSEYGQMILEHYKEKFSRRPGVNLLMFFIDRQMFLVRTDDLPSPRVLHKVYERLDVNRIPFFPESFSAAIECRIQPSTLEGRERARIDTITRLRATGLNKFQGPILALCEK